MPELNTFKPALCSIALFISLLLFGQGTHASEDTWARSYNLERAGQPIAAVESLEPILKQQPQHELALLRSGWLYYLAGNYSRAIKFYQTALQVNKDSLEARLGMTLPLLAQARWREAAIEAQAVISESKWDYYANLRLMVAEEGLKQWKTLKQHAQQLNRRYPSDASFLVYLARAHIHLGEPAGAREAYGKVLELFPGHLEASRFLVE